jgi:hypothetical protein
MVYLGLPFLKKWWIFPWRKVTNVTNGQIVQMADVPTFDQLIAFSDQDVLGTPGESYPWQKGDPILAPRRWNFVSGFLQRMMIFVVVVYRLEMILYGL